MEFFIVGGIEHAPTPAMCAYISKYIEGSVASEHGELLMPRAYGQGGENDTAAFIACGTIANNSNITHIEKMPFSAASPVLMENVGDISIKYLMSTSESIDDSKMVIFGGLSFLQFTQLNSEISFITEITVTEHSTLTVGRSSCCSAMNKTELYYLVFGGYTNYFFDIKLTEKIIDAGGNVAIHSELSNAHIGGMAISSLECCIVVGGNDGRASPMERVAYSTGTTNVEGIPDDNIIQYLLDNTGGNTIALTQSPVVGVTENYQYGIAVDAFNAAYGYIAGYKTSTTIMSKIKAINIYGDYSVSDHMDMIHPRYGVAKAQH
jgi:hypothetical protein